MPYVWRNLFFHVNTTFGRLFPDADLVIETYAATADIELVLPGIPDGMGGLEFEAEFKFTSLDFTPGSVTFAGQPVDFDGTESDFVAGTYTGTAHVPVNVGPAVAPFHFDFSVTDPPFDGPFDFILPNIKLGPGFSENYLDIVPGPTDLDGLVPNWQSSVVPELNGKPVFFFGPHELQNVLPEGEDGLFGQFSLSTIGHTNISVVPEPSTFALAFLGLLGLLGWGWRRRRQKSR
ncbi:MAG: PEP-CTERM sorting domain-containing protein [Pirellulaceae bacterium]